MAIGIALPPLQLPLVIGGVFIGKNLGRSLGYIGGKIASDFANNFIVDHLLTPYMKKKLLAMINQGFYNASTAKEVICRSDICAKGSAEYKCGCRSCKGVMQYSDSKGAASCKTCGLGTYPVSNYNRQNIGCRKCAIGTYGTSEGKCHSCNGVMNYGDTEGATSCKNCIVGTIPVRSFYQRNIRCAKCPVGTIGKSDGECHTCNGVMEYGDTEGATSCKTCKIGTVPDHNYYQRNYRCVHCRIGTIGKDDGKCHWCDGPMEFSDVSGATSCKRCPMGSIPRKDYNRYQIGCYKCRIGTIGKADGKCYWCDGPMEYSDQKGATTCKICPPGSVPRKDYNRYHYGCSKCRIGTIGKSDGKCYRCDGPREYSDVAGATSCKTCPPGHTVLKNYNHYHYGCKK